MNSDPPRPTFVLNRLTEYTDEAILSELRRVADAVPNGPITAAVIGKHGRVGAATIRSRFATLGRALEAAGLAHRSTEVLKTRGGQIATKLSNDDVLKALRELAGRLGKDTLTGDDVDLHLPFSSDILRKRWGTVRSAFESAGVGVTKLGRRYTDEECFNNMLAVWTHHGRPPMHKEMSQIPSVVGGKAYMLRFGTWNKALAAFVERVNLDRYPEAAEDSETPNLKFENSKLATAGAISTGSAETGPVENASDRRDIPIGLRFRVFHRDRFKCVICGDHPARNSECVLHVDHIVPWSRGGKTREDNLRTLCARCNVGRGNRFTE
jgi:hypothetical protein